MAGRVASLHLHAGPGEPLVAVEAVFAEAGLGLRGSRKYGRKPDGTESKRQVSLIEREVLAQHARALGCVIPPGAARSNVETVGVDLVPLVGRRLMIGEAEIEVTLARTPCEAMDLVAPGLQEAMRGGRQGVLARVVRSGLIRVGDAIVALPSDGEAAGQG